MKEDYFQAFKMCWDAGTDFDPWDVKWTYNTSYQGRDLRLHYSWMGKKPTWKDLNNSWNTYLKETEANFQSDSPQAVKLAY